MTQLAVLAGLDPRVVADCDEDEFKALAEAVREKHRMDSWTNTHEVLAAAVEALWSVLAQLQAGIPVVQVRTTKKAREPEPYPRPEWVKPAGTSDDGVVVVASPGDALRMMKAGANRVD